MLNWLKINVINEELKPVNDIKVLKITVPTFPSVYFNNEQIWMKVHFKILHISMRKGKYF